jgi:hypothetical protein
MEKFNAEEEQKASLRRAALRAKSTWAILL